MKKLPTLILLFITAPLLLAQGNEKFIPNGNNTQRLLQSVKAQGLKSEADKQLYFSALYHAGQTSAAVDYYKKLDQTKVTKPIQKIYIRCLMSQYKYKEAYMLLKKLLLKEKTTDVDLEILLAQCLIQIKEFDHPMKILTDIISVEPDNARAHYYLSLIYVAKGKLNEAIKHAETTILNSERNSLLARKATTVILSSRFKQANAQEKKIKENFEKDKKK